MKVYQTEKRKKEKIGGDLIVDTSDLPITDDNKLLTSSPLENVNIEMEDNSGSLQNSLESPPYSCLKNGSKPTYREWKKTQKNDDVLFNHKKRKVRLGKHDGKVSILISPKLVRIYLGNIYY